MVPRAFAASPLPACAAVALQQKLLLQNDHNGASCSGHTGNEPTKPRPTKTRSRPGTSPTFLNPPPPFLRTRIDSTKRQGIRALFSRVSTCFYLTLSGSSFSHSSLQGYNAWTHQLKVKATCSFSHPLQTTRLSIPVYFQSSPGQHPHPTYPTLHPKRKRYVL